MGGRLRLESVATLVWNTHYALADVMQLAGAHAYRLYELLIQYLEIGKREIAVEDLRRWLDLGEKYNALYDLKKRVIDPAVSQINDRTPLQVSYVQKKSGRTITHLTFSFYKKTPGNELPEAKKKKYVAADLHKNSKLAKPGETLEVALARLNRVGPAEL